MIRERGINMQYTHYEKIPMDNNMRKRADRIVIPDSRTNPNLPEYPNNFVISFSWKVFMATEMQTISNCDAFQVYVPERRHEIQNYETNPDPPK